MIDASLALNIDPNREPEPTHDDHEPQHDYIFVWPMPDEMRSKAGVIMPNVVDPTGNKRSSGPCQVIAVGPGPWTDRVDANGQFLRRPMCCSPGDIIVYQGGQFYVNVNGRQLAAIQDYQVVDCRRRKE